MIVSCRTVSITWQMERIEPIAKAAGLFVFAQSVVSFALHRCLVMKVQYTPNPMDRCANEYYTDKINRVYRLAYTAETDYRQGPRMSSIAIDEGEEQALGLGSWEEWLVSRAWTWTTFNSFATSIQTRSFFVGQGDNAVSWHAPNIWACINSKFWTPCVTQDFR